MRQGLAGRLLERDLDPAAEEERCRQPERTQVVRPGSKQPHRGAGKEERMQRARQAAVPGNAGKEGGESETDHQRRGQQHRKLPAHAQVR